MISAVNPAAHTGAQGLGLLENLFEHMMLETT